MDVVAEHHRVLRPGLVDQLLVPRRCHDERRLHSTLFPPGSAGNVKCDCGDKDRDDAQEVRGEFHGLAVREMVNLDQKQPIGSADDARADCDQECWGL